MANINIEMEEYLKNLTPEQQEKARECKTKEKTFAVCSRRRQYRKIL